MASDSNNNQDFLLGNVFNVKDKVALVTGPLRHNNISHPRKSHIADRSTQAADQESA
jgi:hypothetical protein